MPLDERFIDPDAKLLARTLARALRSANARLKERRLEKTPEFWQRFARRALKQAEGCQSWEGGRGGRPAPRVEAAWWTDAVGRQHWRIQGRRLDWPGEQPSAFRDFPAWHLYPERLLVRERDGRRDLLAVCSCGVTGPLADIAWMGQRCGPCHDRREESPAALPDENYPLVLKGHASSCGQLVFSSNNQLVSGGYDGRVIRWDLGDGRGEMLLRRNSFVMALAVSPQGAIATSTAASRVLLREPGSDDWRQIAVRSGYIDALAFSHDGRWLAVAGNNAFLIDLGPARPVVLPAPVEEPGGVVFGPDGSSYWAPDGIDDLIRVAPGGRGHTILLPEAEEFDDDWLYGGYGNLPVLACSPDGSRLAVLSEWLPPANHGGIHVGDLASGTWTVLSAPDILATRALVFTSDGLLASADSMGTVTLWGPDGARRGVLHANPNQADEDAVEIVPAFSPDGTQLALGAEDATIRILPWRAIFDGP